jgi:hypothetical protein
MLPALQTAEDFMFPDYLDDEEKDKFIGAALRHVSASLSNIAA